jgi:hypothetical protein
MVESVLPENSYSPENEIYSKMILSSVKCFLLDSSVYLLAFPIHVERKCRGKICLHYLTSEFPLSIFSWWHGPLKDGKSKFNLIFPI